MNSLVSLVVLLTLTGCFLGKDNSSKEDIHVGENSFSSQIIDHSFSQPVASSSSQNLFSGSTGNAINYPTIIAGYRSSLILKGNNLWGVGSNTSGRLGKPKSDTIHFSPVLIASDVIQAEPSSDAVNFIKSDHTLWEVGYNSLLKSNTDTTLTIPQKVMDSVVYFSFGFRTILITKLDGTLWAIGNNEAGQFGNGFTRSEHSLTYVMKGVKKALTEGNSSLILKKDNSLWVVGENSLGQLGTGDTNHVTSPKQIAEDVADIFMSQSSSLILKQDQSLWFAGYQSSVLSDLTIRQELTPVKIMDDVKNASVSNGHCYILKNDNSLWAFGNGVTGLFTYGIGNYVDDSFLTKPTKMMEDVTAVGTAFTHTVIKSSQAGYLSIGRNWNGELGIGSSTKYKEELTKMDF